MSEYKTLRTLYVLHVLNHKIALVKILVHSRRTTSTNLCSIRKHVHFLLGLVFNLASPDAEALILVDEFVDDVPEPLFGEFESHRAVGVCGRKRS